MIQAFVWCSATPEFFDGFGVPLPLCLMVFGFPNHHVRWFSMVVQYWSNCAMVTCHHFGLEDKVKFVLQYRLIRFGQKNSVCCLFVCRYICSSRVGIVAILCLHLPRFQSRGSVGGQLPTMGPAPEVTFTLFS